MITSHKERRAFARMVINAPVTVRQQHLVLEGVCRDLSANGMKIELCEQPLDLAGPIKVTLNTNSELLPPLKAHARIVRVLEEQSNKLLAVEFHSLS